MLGASVPLVSQYILSQQTSDGSFQDRAGNPDLYYTVFGLESLAALQVDSPVCVVAYLKSFGDGAELDLVHLCCLARCWASPVVDGGEAPREALAQRIESHRTDDGGYGSLYRCFLALGACQDLQTETPDLLAVLDQYRTADGGFADRPGMPSGLTPSTTAAATLLRQLGQPPDPDLADWLLARLHPQGGFFATPLAPIPDLLSTATALHALGALQWSPEPIREACLDFIDTLWSNRGAFCGNWQDDTFDCEYTYYGLLALGHLSL